MSHKDTHDIVGGLALAVLGGAAAFTAREYDFGDLQRMGAGFFPVVLGIVLSILGLLIAIPAFMRCGEPIRAEWKNLLFVTASILAFALTLKLIGLVLATMLSVFIALVPEKETRFQGSLLIAAGVALITYLIFSFGLGMVLPVWPWSA